MPDANGPPAADNDPTAFCEALVRKDARALAAFVLRFAAELTTAYREEWRDLRSDFPPGCPLSFDDVVPHVGSRAGAGALKHKPVRPLEEHVPTLALRDLFLVAACLEGDDAASRKFAKVFEDVAGKVAARKAPGLGLQRDDAQSELSGEMGRLWMALGDYLGTSSLTSWLYISLTHALIDIVRRRRGGQPPDPPPGDDDEAPEAPVPSAPVDATLFEKIRDEIKRSLTEIREWLLGELAAIRARSERRYCVAFLAYYCHFRNADIADVLHVARPRVTQLRNEIDAQLQANAEPLCENLERRIGGLVSHLPDQTDRAPRASEVSAQRIWKVLEATIREEPERYFEPNLYTQVLAAYRCLLTIRPDLLHVARLLWCDGLSPDEIGRRVPETPLRVARLIEQLSAWQRLEAQRLTEVMWPLARVSEDQLSPAALQQQIEVVIRRWLCEV